MPLRSLKFLDAETLFALAEYADVQVPLQQEITERTTKNRKGAGKLGLGGSTLGGELGSGVEIQTSYTLAPSQKAAVSKVLDQLIDGGHVVSPDDNQALHKDLPVMLEGTARLTTASVAGKLMYVALQAVRASESSLDDLTAGRMPEAVGQGLKNVYLGNELLPIPMLFELEGSSLAPRVLISTRPGHFVESATPERVEGEIGVVGVVELLIAEGGYASSEKWLLHDWEWLMKRKLMTTMDDAVAKLAATLDIDLPDDDVQAYIAGPAVVIDALVVF